MKNASAVQPVSMKQRAWARKAIEEASGPKYREIREMFVRPETLLTYQQFVAAFKAGKLRLRPASPDKCRCLTPASSIKEVFDIGDPQTRDYAAQEAAEDEFKNFLRLTERHVSLDAIDGPGLQAAIDSVVNYKLPAKFLPKKK